MDEKILLVDDEEDIREILGMSLEETGYRVKTAESGEDALSCLEEEGFPVVICDIKMPGMDGITLLQKIKKQYPETEVIMITGHGDMDLAIKSLKHDACDFVTKPVNDDVLEIALKRAKERIVMRETLRAYTENLESLVAEKSRKLVEAERMAAVGETVSGLSHAIRNIAGALKGGMYVLEKGLELDSGDYLHKGWGMIRGNVEKIQKLATDLLNFGKSQEVHCIKTDPHVPLSEAVELIRPEAETYGIFLEMDTDKKIKPIDLDPEWISRCLTNVLKNAIDAIAYDTDAEKEKIIRITTRKTDSGGIEYRITDTGKGMDEETKEKIFRSFFTTKGTRGTGIGLMMTRKVIELHRGTITCDTEEGRGTTFAVSLPPGRVKKHGITSL